MAIRATKNSRERKMKNFFYNIFDEFSFHEKKHDNSSLIFVEVYYVLYCICYKLEHT